MDVFIHEGKFYFYHTNSLEYRVERETSGSFCGDVIEKSINSVAEKP